MQQKSSRITISKITATTTRIHHTPAKPVFFCAADTNTTRTSHCEKKLARACRRATQPKANVVFAPIGCLSLSGAGAKA